MNFKFPITTERLLINPLSTSDSTFIFELLNTEGWIRFIGDRNLHSEEDALAYIHKILRNKDILYCVVKLRDSEQSIGIVSYIKRDYLEHHDIGFAFLPEFSKKGYAYEATAAVLKMLQAEHKLSYIIATTIPENQASIQLLEKMGLKYEKEILLDKEKLLVYGISLTE